VHLYAGARYIVIRGLGHECSKRPNPSEYWRPYARFCIGTSENLPFQALGWKRRLRLASELGCPLRILLPRREARLGVPRGERAGRLPLAHPHHLQVALGDYYRREANNDGTLQKYACDLPHDCLDRVLW
jgi:hypothetical protein